MVNYRYLIIGKGEGSYLKELKFYISKNELSDKVTLIGYVDNADMYCYYSAADIYAHVSMFEGQSLSEMEAASTGLRVIVNKSLVETLPDKVDENSNMYYVLDYDALDYGGFKTWARKETEKRHSISYYSWVTIVEKYYTIFKRIVDNT